MPRLKVAVQISVPVQTIIGSIFAGNWKN